MGKALTTIRARALAALIPPLRLHPNSTRRASTYPHARLAAAAASLRNGALDPETASNSPRALSGSPAAKMPPQRSASSAAPASVICKHAPRSPNVTGCYARLPNAFSEVCRWRRRHNTSTSTNALQRQCVGA